MFRLLVECLVDAGKDRDAADYCKVTSDFIEQHTPELYPRIFSIQVNHLLSPLVYCIVYYILPRQLSTADSLSVLCSQTRPVYFHFWSLINMSVPQMCCRFCNSWYSVWHDSQVQHDLIDVSNILTSTNPKLLAIYKLQKLKKWVAWFHRFH